MDKLKKFLRKLPKTEQEKIVSVLYQIRSKQFEGLSLKPLRDSDEHFWARVGNYRIIYRLSQGEIEIIDVGNRSEKSYRDVGS